MQEFVHRGSRVGEKTRKFGKSKRERDHEATGRPDLSNSSKNELQLLFIYIKISNQRKSMHRFVFRITGCLCSTRASLDRKCSTRRFEAVATRIISTSIVNALPTNTKTDRS